MYHMLGSKLNDFIHGNPEIEKFCYSYLIGEIRLLNLTQGYSGNFPSMFLGAWSCQ